MLDLAYIREHPEEIKRGAAQKRIQVDVDRLLALDAERRALIKEVESLRAMKNAASDRIAKLAGEEKARAVAEMRAASAREKDLSGRLKEVETELEALLLLVPSPPADDVPEGDESANAVIRTWGTPPRFDFTPRDHVELAEGLDIIDIPRGVKVSGARFYYLKNEGALLHWAVCRFALDHLVRKGFTPLYVPVLVKREAMVGTGYFPGGEEQAYKIPEDELFLVGTAEVSLCAYHADEILSEDELPKRYVGYSSCFRREAGTYGKDTRGVYRIHQFDKVEQVVICRNDLETSIREQEFIQENAEEIVRALGLPHRVVVVATGEMGQGQVKKYDIETWMPGRGGYGETHSCSRFHDFQARRLNLRYRKKDGGIEFCHTLNNTAIASPRILIAILENYQREDGSVIVPEVLRPYMGGMEVIRPKRQGS
ncbi:MAG: serine--tRNA ligase [Firmicutes bacterium]|nr:serine--tRNA ligase [Bacillota bacterium]